MRHNKVKQVITKKGKVIYYVGDGSFFGRCSKKEAEQKMLSGEWYLFDTVHK